ncbi:hypothetical protein BKA70DRAFT_1111294, partial [Coprinopsis sp. MPI-PUGE-AT-0042]
VVEYFQTLDQEMSLVWPTPWNTVKGLYILNRYVVVIPVCLCIYCTSPPPPCLSRYIFACSPTVEVSWAASNEDSAAAVSEPWKILLCMRYPNTITLTAMLFIRVWALADRSKKIMIFLFAFLSVGLSCALVCYIPFFLSMEYARSPTRSITKCVLMASNNRLLIYAFTSVVLEQAMIMSICIYLGKKRHLGTESPLIRTIFMDGGIYFAVLTLMSLANLFAVIDTPDGFQFVLAAYQGVFHSTLTSRMFLNLRKLAAKDRGAATDLISRELAVLNIKTAHTATRTTTNLSSVRARATPTTAEVRSMGMGRTSRRRDQDIPVLAYTTETGRGNFEAKFDSGDRVIDCWG